VPDSSRSRGMFRSVSLSRAVASKSIADRSSDRLYLGVDHRGKLELFCGDIHWKAMDFRGRGMPSQPCWILLRSEPQDCGDP
jgi:hypothetical protein